jgi:hypothetical protein
VQRPRSYSADVFATQASRWLDGHGEAFHLGLQGPRHFRELLCRIRSADLLVSTNTKGYQLRCHRHHNGPSGQQLGQLLHGPSKRLRNTRRCCLRRFHAEDGGNGESRVRKQFAVFQCARWHIGLPTGHANRQAAVFPGAKRPDCHGLREPQGHF